MIGTKSFDAMWAEIASDVTEKLPPPGAMSAMDFSTKYGVSVDVAQNKLTRLAKAGKVTSDRYRVRIQGRLRSIIYYVPVKP